MIADGYFLGQTLKASQLELQGDVWLTEWVHFIGAAYPRGREYVNIDHAPVAGGLWPEVGVVLRMIDVDAGEILFEKLWGGDWW